MKAAIYYDYGSPDVLRLEEIETPVPAANEILIRVRAAAVNPADWKAMSGGPPLIRGLLSLGRRKMKRCGIDVAGQVEVVGSSIAHFKPGDQVFGTCRAAFAEYVCISDSPSIMKSVLVTKPENVTFEQAASAPVAGLTALQALRDKGKIKPGQRILINGAAGGVGTFAVQIARSLGAEVTGVCSTRNLEMVSSLGADHVIDYGQEDFTAVDHRYDILLDCVGNRSLSACRRILNRHGVYVMIGVPSDMPILSLLARLVATLLLSVFSSQRFVFFIARPNRDDLSLIGKLMAAGKVEPVIDRRYGLGQVALALQYLAEGHARGKVIVTSGEKTER